MPIKASTTISLVRVNDGTDGKGIQSTIAEYYLSTSSTAQSGGSWVTAPPAWVDGRYYWTRTKITYTDNTTSTTTPICVTGGKGATGSTGATGSPGASGKGVSSITLLYYLSDSETLLTGGAWVTTIPEWEYDKWIWSKTKVTYTDNTTSETVAVVDQALNLAGNASQEVEDLRSTTTASFEIIGDALVTKVEESQYESDRLDMIDRITGKANNDDLVALEQLQATMLQTQDQWAVIVSEIQQATGEMDVTVNQVKAYMAFGVDGLKLGNPDSDLKIRIDHERISFMDGDAEVAYITGQRLHITAATIVDSLQVGNHVIEKWGTSGQFTVFKYVGG